MAGHPEGDSVQCHVKTGAAGAIRPLSCVTRSDGELSPRVGRTINHLPRGLRLVRIYMLRLEETTGKRHSAARNGHRRRREIGFEQGLSTAAACHEANRA